jgi:hypothetical protein
VTVSEYGGLLIWRIKKATQHIGRTISAERNKETVRRWIEEVWRTGNADLMDENMLDHNPIPGLPAGRAARKQILAMFHAVGAGGGLGLPPKPVPRPDAALRR